jgi:hypothetical protein
MRGGELQPRGLLPINIFHLSLSETSTSITLSLLLNIILNILFYHIFTYSEQESLQVDISSKSRMSLSWESKYKQVLLSFLDWSIPNPLRSNTIIVSHRSCQMSQKFQAKCLLSSSNQKPNHPTVSRLTFEIISFRTPECLKPFLSSETRSCASSRATCI